MSPEANERLTLARVVRPHGIRGEVAAIILTDFPERLTKLREVWLWDGRTEPRRAEVRQCRLTASRGGHALIHFAGVDSIDTAKKLRGLDVQVPISTRTKLPESSYYISDLVGCEVWERSTLLGVVKGVQQEGTPVLEIDAPEGELLVPLAQEICTKIDTAARRIEVILPEGLRDLNKPAPSQKTKASSKATASRKAEAKTTG
ncbi:MAG: ribosome maturation factor RimM [Candidatus Acidiferrales bacterium]